MTDDERADYERERDELAARYDRPTVWRWETGAPDPDAPPAVPPPGSPRAQVHRILQINATEACALGLIVPGGATIAQDAPGSPVRGDRGVAAIVRHDDARRASQAIVGRGDPVLDAAALYAILFALIWIAAIALVVHLT